MPDWLREALLARLEPDDERQTRELLQSMLGSLSVEPTQDIPLHIATGSPQLHGESSGFVQWTFKAMGQWCKSKQVEQLVHSAPPNSPLRDYVFLRFLSGRPLRKLTPSAPAALLQFLFAGRRPIIGIRPLFAFLIAAAITSVLVFTLEPWRSGNYFVKGPWFSQDGRSVSTLFATLSASRYEPLTLTASGMLISNLQQTQNKLVMVNRNFIYSSALSPDRSLLAFFDHDKQLRLFLWDLARGTEVAELAESSSGGSSLAFSPDGTLLAFPTVVRPKIVSLRDYIEVLFKAPRGRVGNTITIWNVTERSVVGQLNATSPVQSLAFSFDSGLLATGHSDGNVLIWKTQTKDTIGPIKTGDRRVVSLTFSPDGRLLAIGNGNGAVSIYDIITMGLVGNIAPYDELEIASITFSPNGKLLVVSYAHNYGTRESGRVLLFDVARRLVISDLVGTQKKPYHGVDFSPDGKLLAGLDRNGIIDFWRIPDGYPAIEPASTALQEAEVRAWIKHYRNAWESKDVNALVKLGEVSTENANWLRRVLTSYGDLRVELKDLEIKMKGDRADVSFRREDTIDGKKLLPPGRMVLVLYKQPDGSINVDHDIQIPVNGEPVQGSISTVAETDLYNFTATVKGLYTIETEGATDTSLTLFGPDNQKSFIAEDDDSGVGANSRISSVLGAGTYLVRLRPYSHKSTGTYSISVRTQEGTLRQTPTGGVLDIDLINSKAQEDRKTVLQTQSLLRSLGYPVVRDGIPGPQTRAAVRDFQTNHNMLVTGVLDQTLLRSLTDAQAQEYLKQRSDKARKAPTRELEQRELSREPVSDDPWFGKRKKRILKYAD